MQDHTSGSRIVAAPLTACLDIVLDIEAYPRWAAQIVEAHVLQRDARRVPTRARLTMDAGPLKDTMVFDYRVQPGAGGVRVAWTLVEAEHLKALDGAYDLSVVDGVTTRVEYSLAVDAVMPMVRALRRKAESAIVTTAVADFARHAESIGAP